MMYYTVTLICSISASLKISYASDPEGILDINSLEYMRTVLDMSISYMRAKNLHGFTIYSDKVIPALQWLKTRNPSLMMGFAPCNARLTSLGVRSVVSENKTLGPPGPAGHGDGTTYPYKIIHKKHHNLEVLFCDKEQQETIIKKAVTDGEITQSHWFLVTGEGNPRLRPFVFLPIDSMVIQVLVPKSLLPVVLQETWSPGEGIPHKTTALGVYKLSGDEPPKTYQQKAFFSQGYVDETKNEEKINKEENLISYNTSKVYNRITELQKMLFKATHVEDNIPVINSSKINPKSIKTISSKREIRSLDVITLSAPQYLSSNEPPSVPPQLKLRKAPFYLSRLDLTGVHFVVTTINDSKAHKSYFDPEEGRVVMAGFFGSIFEILKKRMNFTYSVMSPSDGEYGIQLSNGSWTGLVGDVLSHRADIIVAFLSMTVTRSEAVDFSARVVNFRYRLYAQPPIEGLMWKAYTRPFAQSLWGFVFILFMLITMTFAVTSRFLKRVYTIKRKKRHHSIQSGMATNSVYSQTKKRSSLKSGKKMSSSMTAYDRTTSKPDHKCDKIANRLQNWYFESPLLVWGSFMQQGWPDSPDESVLRLVFWTSYMTGVILLAAYSATLVSFLTVVVSELPFDSLESMRGLGSYRLGIQLGSKIEELLKIPSMVKYYNSLVAPFADTKDRNFYALRQRAIEDPKFAIIASYEVQRSTYDGACKLQHAKQDLLFNDGAFAFPINSPYMPVFSFLITLLRESGILDKFVLKYYPVSPPCVESSDMALSVSQVFTAFLVLIAALILSFVIFLLEQVLYRNKYLIGLPMSYWSRS